MSDDKQTAELAERMAIAFHNSQFNNGNYGLPWEKVSKESKLRYMKGMVAVIEATGQARDAEVAELVAALEEAAFNAGSLLGEARSNRNFPCETRSEEMWLEKCQPLLAKHKQEGGYGSV